MFEKAGSDCSESSDELDEEIMKNNLRGKHHIDFIGIKPKIDTNRPLTKVQSQKQIHKRIKDEKLARKLQSQFIQKMGKQRKGEDQLEQLGARKDQWKLMQEAKSVKPTGRAKQIMA